MYGVNASVPKTLIRHIVASVADETESSALRQVLRDILDTPVSPELLPANAVLLKWLRNFYRRFFSQQFKRSCLPDGPKVGSVTLSPRGDWRMPSDASAALWVAQADALEV